MLDIGKSRKAGPDGFGLALKHRLCVVTIPYLENINPGLIQRGFDQIPHRSAHGKVLIQAQQVHRDVKTFIINRYTHAACVNLH